jgi:hypothetical protein
MNPHACLLPVLIIVSLMQSIGSNNDSTYTLYVPPHAPCPWFGLLAIFRAMPLVWLIGHFPGHGS